MNRLASGVLILVVLLAMSPRPAAARAETLDSWVEQSLLPDLLETLSTHARFKGEPIRFVVFRNGEAAAASNALAIDLRNRLADEAIASGGIRVASPAGKPTVGQRIDCERGAADYLVGIEVTRGSGSTATVIVRALDVHENAFVSGFVYNWRGNLNRSEIRAAEMPRADDGQRGARGAPFGAHETDLLAAHLARSLSCQLLGAGAADYIVQVGQADTGSTDPLWQRTLDIAGRYVASHAAIELAADDASATAQLAGTAHEIDAGLYQYWLTLRPTDAAESVETLIASAYVQHGGLAAGKVTRGSPGATAALSQTSSPRAVAMPGAHREDVLGPLRLAQSGGGSVLKTNVRSDVVVFFLQYQPRLGLMRLGDQRCRPRTIARIARAGELLAYPLGDQAVGSRTTAELPVWQVMPAHTTYFAVAVEDSRLARRLANHVDRLPMRCGGTSPPGLRDEALWQWHEQFADLAEDGAQHVAWRALEMREVL